jgi:U4/U6.U5 tri-snRNP component SNU23
VGVSTKVEKADLNSVKERLAMLKRKKENPENDEYSRYFMKRCDRVY